MAGILRRGLPSAVCIMVGNAGLVGFWLREFFVRDCGVERRCWWPSGWGENEFCPAGGGPTFWVQNTGVLRRGPAENHSIVSVPRGARGAELGGFTVVAAREA